MQKAKTRIFPFFSNQQTFRWWKQNEIKNSKAKEKYFENSENSHLFLN